MLEVIITTGDPATRFQSLQVLCCMVSDVSEIFWICCIASMMPRGLSIWVYDSVTDQSLKVVSNLARRLGPGRVSRSVSLRLWNVQLPLTSTFCFSSLVTQHFGWFKCWKWPVISVSIGEYLKHTRAGLVAGKVDMKSLPQKTSLNVVHCYHP